MISRGVMEINSGIYKIGCSCGSSDCDLMLIVDSESINIYSDLNWSSYTYSDSLILEKIYSMWNRIKTAIKILILGRFKLSSELIIIDEEHAKNIAEVLLKKVE